MDDTKLTVRVSRDLIDNAKRYAAQNHTTLSRLVEAYLRSLLVQASLTNAPIVRRLSGVLSQGVNIQDHKDHLEEKFGE